MAPRDDAFGSLRIAATVAPLPRLTDAELGDVAERVLARGTGLLTRVSRADRVRRVVRGLSIAALGLVLLPLLGALLSPALLLLALPLPFLWAKRALRKPLHRGGVLPPPSVIAVKTRAIGGALARGAKLLGRLLLGLVVWALSPLGCVVAFGALAVSRARQTFSTRSRVPAVLSKVARLTHRFAPTYALPGVAGRHVFGLTFVTRHADVSHALTRDDALRVSIYDYRMRRTSGPFLLGQDDELHDHARARAELAVRDGEATPDRKRVQDLVTRASQTLVEQAARRNPRSIDVVGELGNVVPLLVAREYFGIGDTADQALLPSLQAMSFYIFNFWIGGPYAVRAERAAERLKRHLRSVIDERLADPSNSHDDVLQRLLDQAASGHGAGAAGTPLSEDERDQITSNLLGLLSGSIVATIGTFVGSLERLLDLSAEERARVSAACRENGKAFDAMVTEAGRFAAFPPLIYRVARRDFALVPGTEHERLVKAGSMVVSAPALANLDARVYPAPERCDLDRFVGDDAPPAPLNFGWGTHRCLGEHLGKTMVREMIRALFLRPNLRRAAWPEGKVQKGDPHALPEADYAQRLVVLFD